VTSGPGDEHHGDGPSVALVETSDLLPGLLPFQAWDVLGTAELILARDADTHPSAEQFHLAGLDLVTIEPAALGRGDLDLSRPGLPDDRRVAKALVRAALDRGRVVYLLGEDDRGVAPALAGMAAEHDLEIELVFLAQQPPGTEFVRLVDVLRQLRDPEGGCPWDLEQDHQSLLRYLIEESYELVEAVEEGDDTDLREELGDVLLQVVFHAQVASDRSAFGIDDVVRGIVEKLVRRHPHVFGDGDAASADEVQARWDELKAEEKERGSPFDGVPSAAPGLDLLHTLQRKAARHGLQDPEQPPAEQALAAHVSAARAGRDDDACEAAVGSLLAAVVTLAGEVGVDPEAAARREARHLRRRTERALAELGGLPSTGSSVDPERWRAAWSSAGEPGEGG